MRKTTTKSNIVGLKELREDMETYIARVDQGESFTVVRRSRPVFKIAPVDEEESGWETVVDFTQFRKGGVPIDEVIARLQRLK